MTQKDVTEMSYKELQEAAKEGGLKHIGVSKDDLRNAVADLLGKPREEESADTESSTKPRGRQIEPLTEDQQALVDSVTATPQSKSASIRALLRAEAGLTRGQIARALDVRYQMVYQIENKMQEQGTEHEPKQRTSHKKEASADEKKLVQQEIKKAEPAEQSAEKELPKPRAEEADSEEEQAATANPIERISRMIAQNPPRSRGQRPGDANGRRGAAR